MKKLSPPFYLSGRILSIALLCSTLAACAIFPKGVRSLTKKEYPKAKDRFQQSLDHRVFDPGARYYLERLKVMDTEHVPIWLASHQTLCGLESEVRSLPYAQALKLERYDITSGKIHTVRNNLQERIFKRMFTAGTIEELLILEENSACWSDGALDSLRSMIVNKTINPKLQVYDTEDRLPWERQATEAPAPDAKAVDRTCRELAQVRHLTIRYPEADVIAKKYADVVLPANYRTFWDIQQHIWDLFQRDNSYCRMDSFQQAYPGTLPANDCWFDKAREVLCSGRLKPLLSFHRNNPHTMLDNEVSNQILCLALAGQAAELDADERRQVADILSMSAIQHQLQDCEPLPDSLELIREVVRLAEKYKHHWVMFDLARQTLDFFAARNCFALAGQALQSLQPLFPDTSACDGHLLFNLPGKQDWFNNFAALLQETTTEKMSPHPAIAWNTPDNDEFALISWGETHEVFFARRNKGSGLTSVMTSVFQKGNWSHPAPVEKLAVGEDVAPLSMSANGLSILLRSGGKVWQSYRRAVGRPWSSPEEIQMHSRFAGHAWISPDDSLRFATFYSSGVSATAFPAIDIGVSKLQADGHYGRTALLNSKINLPISDEGSPNMALGGRLFLYTSDRQPGVGKLDMYSVSLSKPNDWSTMNSPKNLGFPLNTLGDDDGITYFSEYTGKAYFHRNDPCREDQDIWEVGLGPGIFPENAMRLAGLVLDEHRRPVGGGFMEFTADYDLHVHDEPISTSGAYSYTVADSTEVVRLFPEIPGYYSEKDATHFLADVAKGEIIRDTFILTSFEYIRQHFKLEHSTFYHQTSEFDQPEKAFPEITRLARIATRMGADLVLHGHTDNVGDPAENLKLSIARAQSVKDFLVEKCGFPAERITVEGFGATRPICSNDTEEGRRCNRRVEIKFAMPELINDK